MPDNIWKEMIALPYSGMRWFWVIVGVSAVVGCTTARKPEPVIDNKPLSLWLRSYKDSEWNSRDRKPLEQYQADHAMEVAGTSAVPTLLWMLSASDPKLNFGAAYGFERLGSEAYSAVRKLIHIYQTDVSDQSQAAVAKSLGAIGNAARDALQILIEGTSHTNDQVLHECLISLVRIGGDRNAIVPILLRSLQDPQIREYAELGLEKFSLEENAHDMIPILNGCIAHPDPNVRRVAERITKQIQDDL